MGWSLLIKQFLLLLWKNFVLQIRRPISTVFEILVPTFAILLLIVLRLANVLPPTDVCFLTFEPDSLTAPNVSTGLPYNIYFTPNNAKTNEIVHRVVERLGIATETIGFDNETDMVDNLTMFLSSSGRQQSCFMSGAGVVFDRLEGSDIEYTLRLRQPSESWGTASRGDTGQLGSRTTNLYLEEGFLHLQNAISLSIIEHLSNRTINIKVSVEQFPYPPYIMDNFYASLSSNFAVLVIMAFIISAAFFVKELVLEKESRIRETMFMMGLKQSILWSTWYLKEFIFLMISVIIVCILLKAGQVFPRTDFLVLLLFFIIFILSVISFCFFISVWFNSARLGLAMGFTFFFLSFAPFYLVQPIGFETLGFGGKMGMCVLSNACMALGIEVITRLELRLEGLQWSNLATPISEDDQFNIGWVFLMLLIETVFYMVLAWYINGVKPGQYGVRLPFYFPCMPSYWTGRPQKTGEPTTSTQDESLNVANHEAVRQDLEVGISIKHLTKIFDQSFFKKRFSKDEKPQKKAVDNVSLNIYKGQITALLGHNGAGKTTTMSMLTGLYSPTSGTAVINGNSILTDIDEIRKNLGICPQHNVLFDRLTLSEHLAFFLRLKGVFDRKRVREEVASMIKDIDLVEKKDIQASKLSGGMKRKLSVAIALIGGSDVVILDEPTSGMDPYARRSTWDLLAKHKAGRTMLLTTHFMDEADLLGDRIAIMAEGKLRCSGSSLFLKSKFGVGYHMTIVKDSSCDPSSVTSAVKSVVSEAEQATDVGAELSYILPSSATASFPTLFDKLEAEKETLGIQSFGISVTTMEEVFMKVGEDADDEKLQQDGLAVRTTTNFSNDGIAIENLEDPGSEQIDLPASTTSQRKEHLRYSYTPNTGIYLRFQQIWAMLCKKFYISIRIYGFLISQVLFPVFFVILGNVIAALGTRDAGQDPPRTLSLQTSALFANNITLFHAQFGSLGVVNSNELFSLLESPDSGFGASNVFNYTEEIELIRERANRQSQNFNLSDCCNYRFQILDQFCASRSHQQIRDTCQNQNSFGYNTCPDCLSCCVSTASGLSSCSNPPSPMSSFNTQEFCPTPPKLSNSSFLESQQQRGALESDNVYTAEHLLRTFAGISGRPEFYFRSFQAGFTVNLGEPSDSVCGCNGTENILNFFSGDSNDTCGSSVQNECVCGRTPNQTKAVCERGRQTVAAVFPDQERQIEATVWYNNQPLHMSATALGVFHNILLRNEKQSDTISIVVNNHPLPRNASEQISDAASNVQAFAIGSTVGFFIVFAFSSMAASFVVIPVEEKEKKVKHLQFLSGLHSLSYWLASYAWDMLNTLIPIVLTIIVLLAFQVEAYSNSRALGTIFILLILTVWAGIPVSYMASFLFSNSLAANAIVNLAFIFAAILPGVLVLVFRFFVDGGANTANILHHIFLIFPTYGLYTGFSDLYLNEFLRGTCERLDMSREDCLRLDPNFVFVNHPISVERPGIGVILIYLFFEGIVYFILTLLIQESFYIPKLKTLLKKKEAQDQTNVPLLTSQDSDVRAEASKVLSGATSSDDAIVMKNIVKVYSRQLAGCTIKPSKTAVNGISLAIPRGECFGLLGVNGAGKTTTFSILTGEFSMTSGTAQVAGYDVTSNIRDVQQNIGYCPQFNALLEVMTGREVLTLFARLRGVPEKKIKEAVDIEITRLDLKEHADKRCEKYSGGNKRKLCTAIALIGNPPIVLLDEPTTGMDPTTKRYLWDVLTGIIQEGRSIVLTSHSMEECEALCTRLAIMVNGSFKCLGSVQHLKNKFSSGLTLQAKVNLASPPGGPVPLDHVRSPSQQPARQRSRSGSHGYSSLSEEPSAERESSRFETAVEVSGGASNPPKTTRDLYDATSLHSFIRETFPGATLLEEHQGFVSYQLPNNLTWSSTFREIESNKERLGIVDYSVSQTTLDQVFITFAKEQQEEDS